MPKKTKWKKGQYVWVHDIDHSDGQAIRYHAKIVVAESEKYPNQVQVVSSANVPPHYSGNVHVKWLTHARRPGNGS